MFDNLFALLIGGLVWLFCGVCSAITASEKKNNGCAWLFLGCCLGPLGMALSLLLPENKTEMDKKRIADGILKECYYCFEVINKSATVCRYCGKDINEGQHYFNQAMAEWISNEKDKALENLKAAARIGHEKSIEVLNKKGISF